jgi:hypothetical protein
MIGVYLMNRHQDLSAHPVQAHKTSINWSTIWNIAYDMVFMEILQADDFPSTES